MRLALFTTLLIGADQFTKWLAVANLKPKGSVEIIAGFFNLSYVENPGAAWGIMAGKQSLLIGFSIITLGIFIWRRETLFGHLRLSTLIQTLIFGGIVGNLIDRALHNYVIDFLDFHWRSHHFPAFNLADSAICCGVCLFMLLQWVHDAGDKQAI